MRWMHWLVLLLLLIHTPFACTVWSAYRLEDALTEPPDPRPLDRPFSVVAGQILDFRPDDLQEVLELASETGNRFLIYPFRAPREDIGRERAEATGAPDPAETRETAAGNYTVRWIPEANSDEDAAVVPSEALEKELENWQPIREFSRDEAAGRQFAWIVANPSRSLDNAGAWSWIEQFYLFWTYPRERLFLAPSELPQQLDTWQEAQFVRRVQASAVAACGRTLLRQCMGHVATFVQLERGEGDENAVAEALHSGSTYVAFSLLGRGEWFSFHAVYEGRSYRMGSRVPVGAELILEASLPVRFSLIRSGEMLHELEGVRFSFRADEAGAYRLLVHRPDLPIPPTQPWIVSSPIYVGRN